MFSTLRNLQPATNKDLCKSHKTLCHVMLNPERVILNLVQNLQGRLISISALRKTLKRVQGDNKTGIVTAFWTIVAGVR